MIVARVFDTDINARNRWNKYTESLTNNGSIAKYIINEDNMIIEYPESQSTEYFVVCNNMKSAKIAMNGRMFDKVIVDYAFKGSAYVKEYVKSREKSFLKEGDGLVIDKEGDGFANPKEGWDD